MLLPDISKITLDKIHMPLAEEKGIEMDVLRLDKIHPVISGNKWFKLKYHLENFYSGNYTGILTFGGAWSNHIIATACAGFLQKIKTVGIIRGEKPENLSFTLQEAEKYEMELTFISRDLYRTKYSEDFLKIIKDEYPGFYIIPEGGAGMEGEKGAGEILDLADKNYYTHIACAMGTSTMYHGILQASAKDQRVIGIPVLKGMKKTDRHKKSFIFYDYHFGGYAKKTEELINFMNDFYRQTNIPTDFVYTAKFFYAILDLVKKDFFPEYSKLLLLHSGGLQGNSSLTNGTLIYR
jgi:1-aminocyclopropane-1-carboxylate deaminase